MDLFLTGTILKPKGLKGEVKVLPVTDFPELFLSRKSYLAGKSDASVMPLNVLKASLSKGFAWLFFEGVDTLEKAEKLSGMHLFVEEKELARQPTGRAYLHELIGMKVLDGNRYEAGVISDILKMPAHEVYEVQANGRKILIPAVEEFVEEIDMAGRYMVVPRFDEFL
ncbi:ribosome maturation factor RimM [Chlorobium phaeobacteroides]|uniref:Ribosome maturation factor RimM n=1 Tax=Chlorobium phaeobacteroides (strain DSM 266 / SMG 266 / 2430) TaxID=290317 RepID=RIMM_CHLPD|nr:ribosome maturation factor RimM [Chlorobium phaeobacteroides]A1BGL8.1 RecName: Full=Ribosome maturation factor RimM [Chlorobium phaeobacteroides DSM 266]ABL65545.1 16S rRNA processing protein RimM [Chlorobium phaeobacteroides DSM 266]